MPTLSRETSQVGCCYGGKHDVSEKGTMVTEKEMSALTREVIYAWIKSHYVQQTSGVNEETGGITFMH